MLHSLMQAICQDAISCNIPFTLHPLHLCLPGPHLDSLNGSYEISYHLHSHHHQGLLRPGYHSHHLQKRDHLLPRIIRQIPIALQL